MPAPWRATVRVLREVAYGVHASNALLHGVRPSVPPYPPPSLFTVPAPAAAPAPAAGPPGRGWAPPAAGTGAGAGH